MNPKEQFESEKILNVTELGKNNSLKKTAIKFMIDSAVNKYTYNFTWLGRPIIQYPQDMIALQEVIWEVQPDLIIETGIAHGGSLIFSASILELLGKNGQVLGIDIDIRDHNKKEIEKHPLAKRIAMIQGSSIDEKIIQQVHDYAKGKGKVMVILDSNHTHEHVKQELLAYASLVSIGSYLIVFDTAVEDFPEDYNWGGRPWGKGNNPKTAVHDFLKTNGDFGIDKTIDNKLLITVAPDGYLKRIK
jgi:cephalosporin hydroxylase